MKLVEGSQTHSFYGATESLEDYYCNFGVNPEFEPILESAGLVVAARDRDGDVRVVEVPGHPFFLGTLFLPQMRSTRERPHPILSAFEHAVLEPELSEGSPTT